MKNLKLFTSVFLINLIGMQFIGYLFLLIVGVNRTGTGITLMENFIGIPFPFHYYYLYKDTALGAIDSVEKFIWFFIPFNILYFLFTSLILYKIVIKLNSIKDVLKRRSFLIVLLIITVITLLISYLMHFITADVFTPFNY